MGMPRSVFFIAFFLLLAAGGATAQEGYDAASAVSRMNDAIDASMEYFSPQDAYYIGRAVAANILIRYALYTNSPALTRYLNMVCGALTANSDKPEWYNGYHVAILDSPVPNAFSTPGGHIFISRGIINLASSEDMLAAIIAHELAHIQLRHGLLGIQHERLVQDLTGLQNELARVAMPNLAAGELMQQFQEPVHEMVNTLFAKGYSQLQELEADTLAVQLLARAGYDPNSLKEILKIFALRTTEQANSFISSHPVPARRIADVEKQAALYHLPDTRQFRAARFNRIVRRSEPIGCCPFPASPYKFSYFLIRPSISQTRRCFIPISSETIVLTWGGSVSAGCSRNNWYGNISRISHID